ncbi:MAG: YlxR family protein [Dehalococcoidia bacterium]|nr:MAG: YlxR family protein [Dehalococcoidia bacterium]
MKTSKVDDTIQATRQKYVPGRTCVACRATRGKRELVRLVVSEGLIEVDPKGKKPGRGVYLCPRLECWETAFKNNRIEFGLRTKLSAENRQLLLEYGRSLP